ncbi:hypothetical protein L0F63_007254 [Massospora cicadina]|nr:hypothetical protein L0F63_007254 [Massospora cicadina]
MFGITPSPQTANEGYENIDSFIEAPYDRRGYGNWQSMAVWQRRDNRPAPQKLGELTVEAGFKGGILLCWTVGMREKAGGNKWGRELASGVETSRGKSRWLKGMRTQAEGNLHGEGSGTRV